MAVVAIGRESTPTIIKGAGRWPRSLNLLDPVRSLGKTNPLNDDDFTEFVKLEKTLAESPKSVDGQEDRQDDFRSLREEPERRRGNRAP